MLNKKEINFAVVFQEIYIEKLGYSIFIPVAPVIGYLDEKTQVFRDILCGVKYINTDQAMAMGANVSFGCVTPLKDLKKRSMRHGYGDEYIIKTFNALEQCVYFYQNDMKFVGMFRDAFEDENDISLDKYIMPVDTINMMVDSLMSGNISAKDYNETVYGFDKSVLRNVANIEEVKALTSINEMYEKVKSNVISQDEPIKKILTSIYKSRMFKGRNKKSNILVIGPTGVGKTEIFRTISKVLDIPLHIEDMTRYTEVGYVGSSVDDILRNLYYAADEDLDKAENSILVLDEIDKKASKEAGRYDFNKGDVLKSLLKIIEGGVFDIDISRGQTISFDTSNLIIVAAGAFSSLYNSKLTNVIGFNRTNDDNDKKDINNNVLENYGLPIEFLGRFNNVVRMNYLTCNDFVSIMKRSDLSAIKGYIEEFKRLGIDISIPDNIYEKIAKLAFDMGVGARAINSVVDNIFEEILFEVFKDIENIDKIELGEDIISNHSDYVLTKTSRSLPLL